MSPPGGAPGGAALGVRLFFDRFEKVEGLAIEVVVVRAAAVFISAAVDD
ncbi:hypothetical protein [Paraburkholderia franconis]|nr:hypothetical protein [Paraburkholderia franconis]